MSRQPPCNADDNLPVPAEVKMSGNLRRKTECCVMKVPAFWSLGALLAVTFIGKSWVRAARLYLLPEHHDRQFKG